MSEFTDYVIDQIIAFYLGLLTEEEKAELEAWVGASDERRRIFRRIVGLCHRLRLTVGDETAERMRERVRWKLYGRMASGRRHRTVRMVSWAAALVVVLGAGLGYYLSSRETEESRPPRRISALEAKPGERVAVLRLASGSEITLRKADTGRVDIGGGMVFRQDSVRPEQENGAGEDRPAPADTVVHTVWVPRGGEYNLTLADGTAVWLNSESSIRFPARFTGDTREVSVEGEVFFEVRADRERPFVVHAGEAEVRVLGTAFNVVNYPDDPRLEVALLDGKVRFTDSIANGTIEMAPGDVVRMDKADGQTTVSREDVSLIAAWREGYFYFEDMPMEELVVKLRRWYQVDFVFATEDVKRMRFTGAVKRHEPLKDALEVIERTRDINFVDFGGTIKVYKR